MIINARLSVLPSGARENNVAADDFTIFNAQEVCPQYLV
jgi:hypothetical protein